jgi:hypothetical protein
MESELLVMSPNRKLGLRQSRNAVHRPIVLPFWVDILPEQAHALVKCRPKKSVKGWNCSRVHSTC